MRFVAGGDAVAELLLAGTPWQSCCWLGRCGGVAGRGAVAELLAGALRRSCWQGRYGGAVAGRGAVAERLQRGGAVAEMLAAA